MKVFILGAKGFVGSAIVCYCKLKHIEHVPINRDNYKDYVGKSCEIFINANGNSKKYVAENNPDKDFNLSFLSVKKTLTDFNIGKYVYISSIDVYPDCTNSKKNLEDSIIDVGKQSFYGFHKYLSEQIIQKYSKSWLIIRSGGFVGTGLKKNSVFDILNGIPLRVNYKSQYQYLPVDELPKIIFFLLKKKIEGEVFNVCGDGLVSLQEVMEFVDNFKIDHPVNVAKECYNVSINKIKNIYKVPQTKASVQKFINDSIKKK